MKRNKFYLLVLPVLVVFYSTSNLFGQLVSDNTFLQGRWFEAAVAPNGAWGNTVTPPAGYHTHAGGSTGGYTDPATGTAYSGTRTMDFATNVNHDAWATQWGPYYLPGTPFDGWACQINGVHSNAYYTDAGFYNAPGGTLTGTNVGYSNVGGVCKGIWRGSFGPAGCVKITTENRVDTNAEWDVVTVKFVNTGAVALPGLYYFATGDPDNDEPYSGSFPTNNFIYYQGDLFNRHAVGSTPPTGENPSAFSSLATKDCRAKALIYQSWPPSTVAGNDLNLVWSQSTTGMGTCYYGLHNETFSQDIAMGLIFNLGTLAPGDSTFCSFAWIFKDTSVVDSAFPEPLMLVNGTPAIPTATPIAAAYDTVLLCSLPGVTVLPVNFANADSKNWTYSTWTWSPAIGLASTTGVNNTINLAALPGQTTYTITGNDTVHGGCDIRTFYLTIVPCFGANNNGPICEGSLLLLNATGDSVGVTYKWYNASGLLVSTLHHPVFPSTTYADSGLYMVVRTSGGINDTAYTDVHMNWKPTLTLSYNPHLCAGVTDTLYLFAAPDSVGETFSWTGPIGFTSTLVNPIREPFTTIDTGIYTLYVRSDSGCLDTASIDVVQLPQPPAPIISGISQYCTGDAFVPFTVSGTTGTVIWYTSATGGLGSTTPTTINTAIGGSDTVWASQVVGGCESTRGMFVVTVVVTPTTPIISGTNVYCQFYTYIPPTAATVPPTATYETINWYSTSTGGIGSSVPPTISTLIPGVYDIYASATDSGCTSPRADFPITVNPKPAPPVIVDLPNTYCPGAIIVPFDTVSGINITWYASATGSALAGQPTVNTTIPGTDTFWTTQTVLNCISDRSFLTITILPYVTPIFTPTIKYGCSGDTVYLSNTSIGANQYLWEFGDGNSDTTTSPYHVYTNQNTYSITLYATSTSCLDSLSKNVTLLHPLAAHFNVSDSIICQNRVENFTINSITSSLTNFILNFGDGTGNDTLLTTTPTHTYPNVGIYTVTLTATDTIPCTSIFTKPIIVDSTSPIIMNITDTTLCSGADATFTANFTSSGNLGLIWSFAPGDTVVNTNPVAYSYGAAGIYTVYATALYRACNTVQTSRVLTILTQPEINLGSDTSICVGGTPIILIDNTNAGIDGASWLWSTGQTTSYISVGTSGVYKVTVSINGCTATDSIVVSNNCFMDIPNIFSPNGDGLNDYFFPRSTLTRGLTTFKMDIYNRWGELIFESISLDGRGWDGKFNLLDQPEGVYIYIINGTFIDGTTEHHQGNITLIR